MGRVIMNGPARSRDACVACLMSAKQRQWEMFQEEIQAGYAASGEKVTVIPWPDALTKEIADADYRAVCGEFPALGVLDLCWGHVAGINPTQPENSPSPLAAAPAGFKPKRNHG